MNQDNENIKYVTRSKDYVDGSILQFAFRKLKSEFLTTTKLFLLLLVIGIAILLEPFQTNLAFSPEQHIVYWPIVVVPIYFFGAYMSFVFRESAAKFKRTLIECIISLGFFLGVTGAIYVRALNVFVFDVDPAVLMSFPRLVFSVTIIATACVYLELDIFQRLKPIMGYEREASPMTQDRQEPKNNSVRELVMKLSPGNRGNLISVNAEDHYIRVKTSRGEELLLHPFQKLVADLDKDLGVQVHRSWWITFDQIKTFQVEGNKMILIMKDESEIPVGRSFQKQIKLKLNELEIAKL